MSWKREVASDLIFLLLKCPLPTQSRHSIFDFIMMRIHIGVIRLIVVFLLIIVVVCSCSDTQEIKWKYESKEINSYFKNRLDECGVIYRTDKDEFIWYLSTDYFVETVKTEIKERFLMNRVSFTKDDYVDQLCELIKGDGHQCETWYLNGHKYASWLDGGQESANKHLNKIRSLN